MNLSEPESVSMPVPEQEATPAPTPNDDVEEIDSPTDDEIVADGEMNEFNRMQIEYHNEKRRLHGSAPLAYDHDLYLDALEYAEELDRKGGNRLRLKHDPQLNALGQGENLFASTHPGW